MAESFLPSRSQNMHPQSPNVDIAAFVFHYKLLLLLCSPFLKFASFMVDTVQSRSIKLVGILWCFSLFLFILPVGYMIIIVMACFLFVALFGFFNLKTKAFNKFFPNYRINIDKWKEEERNMAQIVSEFRKSLQEIDKIMLTICDYTDSLFLLLRWHEPQSSFRFVLCTVICCVTVLSVGIMGALFYASTVYLLWITVCYQKANMMVNAISNGDVTVSDESGTENFELALDEFSSLSVNETPGLILEKSKEPLYSDADSDTSYGKSDVGRTFLSAKKLLRFRRHRNKSSDVCQDCNVLLSSKRAQTCHNCGQNFCNKCCSLNVPKSALGVTAPSTSRDIVLICFNCHKSIDIGS